MTYADQVRQYFKETAEQCIHYLSIDCIIFGFHEEQLKILLLRWKGTNEWSLPGGFIQKKESVDTAAQRILLERTGLKEIFLQQFHVFGEAERYDQQLNWEKMNLPVDLSEWSERTISIGYYALVDFSKVVPTPDLLTEECRWWDPKDLPNLLFDHQHIIQVALQTLRTQLNGHPIGYNLLPEKFTLPELQRLYETILGRTLDPRNFQRKMLALGILQRLEERRRGGAYKSPYLYRFDTKQYEKALEEGNLAFF